MVVALLLFTPPASSNLVEFAIAQWRREPAMRIEDGYKWLFHATQGGDHAVPDDSGPRRWLKREWSGLTSPRPNEPEVVPLDPKRRVIRLNLRPYRKRGGDSEMLLAVFVASARQFRPEREDFASAWRFLGQRLRREQIGHLTYPEWWRLDRESRRIGYPAIHHSREYEAAAKPAYRVILGELWP